MNLAIIFFLSIVEGIILFGHFLVYKTLTKFWPAVAFWPNLKLITLILGFSFLIFSILINYQFNWFLSWGYYVSSVWLGTLHLLVWASIAVWLLYIPVKIFGLNVSMLLSVKTLFSLAILFSLYGLYHSYQTRVTAYEVTLPNLPAYWQGKKIALVADTHLGDVTNIGFSKKIAKLIAEQNPEAVLIAGDFFDGPPANFTELAMPFGQIKAPSGVFFANGNHEEFSDNRPFAEAIQASGIVNVTNKKTEVKGLQILGVSYAGTGKYEGLLAHLKPLEIDPKKPSILIKHSPNALSAAAESGVSLTVSGHSHSGQVWPGMYFTRKIFKGYDYGLKPFGKMLQITTSGAGTWGPPQRLGTNSEIVILTLN